MKTKTKFAVFSVCSLLALSTIAFAACNKEHGGGKTNEIVTSIIVQAPEKTLYNIGEQLDTTGMKVEAKLDDGTTKTLTASDYEISGFNSETGGKKTVKVAYGGKNKTFRVVVAHDAYKATDGGAEYELTLDRTTRKAVVKLLVGGDVATMSNVSYTLSETQIDNNFDATATLSLTIDADVQAAFKNGETDVSVMYGGIETIKSCFASMFVLDVDEGVANAESPKQIFKYNTADTTITTVGSDAFVTKGTSTEKTDFVNAGGILKVGDTDYIIGATNADGIVSVSAADTDERYEPFDSVINGKTVPVTFDLLTDETCKIIIDASAMNMGNVVLYARYKVEYDILTLTENLPELESDDYASAIYKMVAKKAFLYNKNTLSETEVYTLQMVTSSYTVDITLYALDDTHCVLLAGSIVKPMRVTYSLDSETKDIAFIDAENLDVATSELTSGQQQFFTGFSSKKYMVTEGNIIIEKTIYTATISGMNVTFSITDADTVSVQVSTFDAFEMNYTLDGLEITFTAKGDYTGTAANIAPKLIGSYDIGEGNVLTASGSEEPPVTGDVKGTLSLNGNAYKGQINYSGHDIDVWVQIGSFEDSGTVTVNAGGGTMTCTYTKKGNQVTLSGGDDATGNLAFFKSAILGVWNIA